MGRVKEAFLTTGIEPVMTAEDMLGLHSQCLLTELEGLLKEMEDFIWRDRFYFEAPTRDTLLHLREELSRIIERYR